MRGLFRKRGCGLFSLLFFVCVIIVVILLYDSNTRIVTQEYEILHGDIPVSFDGYRIVLLSDLHNKEFGKDNAKLVEEVRKAQPNIIAFTGDIVEGDGHIGTAVTLMRRLVEIAPVYYVTGNHEWATTEARELIAALRDAGVTVLRSQYETITVGDESITLVGLEDANGPADSKPYEDVFAGLPEAAKDGFIVTLVHRNHLGDTLAPLGSDLILCGHGHGGTVRLPFTDGLVDHSGFFPTHTNGLYPLGGGGETSWLLVSRGLGNAYHVPRLLNNPHVAVAVLRSGK
ncbi:MAG: metallophosphoesterase [Oscillospiraceae bacterium]|jgi:predicted MPP superfamily phosphohydrolase|nr:metallophosphoesterase [Oscillospiraceae bacterium]